MVCSTRNNDLLNAFVQVFLHVFVVTSFLVLIRVVDQLRGLLDLVVVDRICIYPYMTIKGLGLGIQ
jgi:hypothetical protein